MKSSLWTATWIGLVLLASGPPARSQETEPAEGKEKSFWQTVQDKSRSMIDGAGGAIAESGRKALAEAKEKYFPVLREAGYKVFEIRLTIGLAPAVEVRIVRVERLSEEKRQTLLTKYRNDKSATGILETVFAAEKVETEDLELAELYLTLGLHPHATVVLSPKDEV